MVDQTDRRKEDGSIMSMISSSVSLCSLPNYRSSFAPIALFVYNRPEHTQSSVTSLQQNELASRSDLFVFSDGPKDKVGCVAVQQVRRYIRAIEGFKTVTIIERERNLGLANSVIVGITQVCNQFGRVIAMEDDLLTTPDFLTFMNQALDRYENEQRIFSISGFNFGFGGPKAYAYDAFCFYRSSSLGWGTWKDRWERADWTMSDYDPFRIDKKRQQQFNRGGDDLSNMLALQMHGKIDSWAIRWAYTHFKQDGLALLSLRPRVFHIGSDASATYSRRKSFKQSPLTGERKSEFHFPETARLEEDFVLELQRSLRPSLARKLVRYFLHGRIRLGAKRITKGEPSIIPEGNRRSIVD
jgi:hypothetical protein